MLTTRRDCVLFACRQCAASQYEYENRKTDCCRDYIHDVHRMSLCFGICTVKPNQYPDCMAMNTPTAKLNIGLNIGGIPYLCEKEIRDVLTARGFTIHAYAEKLGAYEGMPENTAIVTVSYAVPFYMEEGRFAARQALAQAAHELGQQSIAVRWPAGSGELIGRCAYYFDADFFLD